MKIAITGGGTGGHLAIANSIAKELKNRNIETIFIGSKNGQDQMWFENSDLFNQKYFLDSKGVVNKKGFAKILSLFKIINLAFECKKILRQNQINAVFSVGGYSAAPASFASVICKIPLFIHEQNAFIGRLNNLLKKYAKKIYSSYLEPKYDYPVDEIYFKTARYRDKLKTIIFLGGSQGANFINELAKNLAERLLDQGYNVIHQCGNKNFEETRKFYRDNELNVKVLGFHKEIYKYIASADLAISRAGASALWELCANRLPTIFIPYPFAANDHQNFNAKFLSDKNLAFVCKQEESSESKIYSLIKKVNIKKISHTLEKTISQNGSKKIVDDVLKNLEN